MTVTPEFILRFRALAAPVTVPVTVTVLASTVAVSVPDPPCEKPVILVAKAAASSARAVNGANKTGADTAIITAKRIAQRPFIIFKKVLLLIKFNIIKFSIILNCLYCFPDRLRGG